jgi:hypothetical protein
MDITRRTSIICSELAKVRVSDRLVGMGPGPGGGGAFAQINQTVAEST